MLRSEWLHSMLVGFKMQYYKNLYVIYAFFVFFCFRNYALHLAPKIDPEFTGFPNTHLFLSLILAWLVVYYSLIRGIKSSGKVRIKRQFQLPVTFTLFSLFRKDSC